MAKKKKQKKSINKNIDKKNVVKEDVEKIDVKDNGIDENNINTDSAGDLPEEKEQPPTPPPTDTPGGQPEEKPEEKPNRNLLGTVLRIAVPIVAILIVLYFVLWKDAGYSSKRAKMKEMNVILITIDTLRADYVSVYGKGKARTPNMDRLAQQGVVFEHCVSQTPLTLPAHVSILSGTYPLYHQVRDNGGFLVPGKLELVSEVLQKNGFKTSAFIAAYVLHSKWGISQGFDTYSDKFDQSKYKQILLQNDKRCDEVLGDAQNWLREHKNEKFFSWIHLYDPHTPYTPPAPFDKKNPGRPYAGEVEYVDHNLGLFFDFLKKEGLDKNTLVVLTADHGESLGEFGEPEHGFFIYEPTVWVPLIIKAPFSFPASRVPYTVEHVDLAPTILDAVGIKAPDMYQGLSLVDQLFDRGDPIDKEAYTETYYPRFHFGWSQLKGYYNNKKMKYIQAPTEELFDLNEGEGETSNLALKKSFEKQKLKEKALAFIGDKMKNAIAPGKIDKLDASDAKRLQALGYITTTVDTSNQENFPDPKAKIGIYSDFLKATDLSMNNKDDEAITLLKELIQKAPDVVDAYTLLGNTYLKLKKYPEALAQFYKVLEMRPVGNFTMINILVCLENMGDLDKACEEGEKFLKTFPEDSDLLFRVGNLYYKKKDLDNAFKYVEKAAQVDMTNVTALIRLGEIYLLKEEALSASIFLKQALKVKPKGERIHFLLGQAEDMRGNYKEACLYYKSELEINPKSYEAAFNMAGDLKKLGAFDKAMDYYKYAIKHHPNFNMPYFMIAEYYLKSNTNLYEAINLCKIGVAIKPFDKGTLFGYFLLTNLYAQLGDQANYRLYTQKGDELYRKLSRAMKKGK